MKKEDCSSLWEMTEDSGPEVDGIKIWSVQTDNTGAPDLFIPALLADMHAARTVLHHAA
jgi:hypothetical protein